MIRLLIAPKNCFRNNSEKSPLIGKYSSAIKVKKKKKSSFNLKIVNNNEGVNIYICS